MSLESAKQQKKEQISQLDWNSIPVEFEEGMFWDLSNLTFFDWAQIMNTPGLPHYKICTIENVFEFASQEEAKSAVNKIITAYYNLKCFMVDKIAEVDNAQTEEEVAAIDITLPDLL